MRLTVSVPDKLGKSIKNAAENEGKSISSLTAEALDHYFIEKKKKALGEKLLHIAGKSKVAKDVNEILEKCRMDDRDRS